MSGTTAKVPLIEQIAEAEIHLKNVSRETDLQLEGGHITGEEAMQRIRVATAIVFTLDWLLQNEARIKAKVQGT